MGVPRDDIPPGRRRRKSRTRSFWRNDVRDPAKARRWFVVDAVFLVVFVAVVVVTWTVRDVDTGTAVYITIMATAMAAHTSWELRRLWPVTGWSRGAQGPDAPTVETSTGR